MSLAAALALYTVIALAPLVTVMLTIAGMIFGDKASEGFIQQAQGLIGTAGAEAIRGIVDHAKQPSTGILQGVISFMIVLVSASAIFAQLQTSLNRIWNVVQKPGLGIVHMIRTRLFSMAVVASLGFLLLVSLGVSTAHANRLIVEAKSANDPKAKAKIANKPKSERMSGYTREKEPSARS